MKLSPSSIPIILRLSIPTTAFFACVVFVSLAPAAIVFQADFSGSGTGTGVGNIVTSGGTGSLQTLTGVTQTVTSTSPLGGGSYLSMIASGGSSATGGVTFTPASAANSWASMQDIQGGKVLLNGGMDYFMRVDSSTNLAASLGQFVIGTFGTTIQLTFRQLNNTTQVADVQLRGGGSAFNVLTNTSAGQPTGTQSLFHTTGPNSGSPTFTLGGTYHIGFTFSTDSDTGVVTTRVFMRTDTGAIDTTANTNLIAQSTFIINPSVITADMFAGAWTFQSNSGTSAKELSFDSLRLYDAAPTEFAALVPEPSPALLMGLGLGMALYRPRSRRCRTL